MVDVIRKEKRITDFDQAKEGMHFHTEQYNDLGEILEQALKTIPEISPNFSIDDCKPFAE